MPAASGKKRFWNMVFRISLIVLIAAVAVLGVVVWKYWSADHEYKSVAQEAFDSDANASGALAGYAINWEYLRSVNPDIVAWIYVPGTVINYPVVHTGDNDTYLATSFNGDRPFGIHPGTIFLDAANKGDFSDTNNVMYGHHMDDGSMFACLSTQLSDESEFNAHRTVFVFTPAMNYRCTSFSLVLTTGWDSLAQTSFKDSEERRSYIASIEERSAVQPSGGAPAPSSVEKMFVLSTCDYTQYNGRAVLFTQVAETARPSSAQGEVSAAPDDLAAVQDAAAAAGES